MRLFPTFSAVVAASCALGMSAGAQQLDQKSGPHTQTLGPWDLTAPDSAGLIAGGGSSWGWLNVANAAVSESQAMTSSPIEDQAYANADAGTMLEVGFSGGVTNVAGPDLVMLDAAFDYGLYMIRSDYDGFAAGFTVDINNGVVASTEAYYYEMNGSGPFTANVIGVEVIRCALNASMQPAIQSPWRLCKRVSRSASIT